MHAPSALAFMRLRRILRSRRSACSALWRLKRRALQIPVAVDVRPDFRPLREYNFFAVREGKNRPRRGIASNTFLERPGGSLLVVGKMDKLDTDSEFPALAHAFLRFSLAHHGFRGSSTGN